MNLQEIHKLFKQYPYTIIAKENNTQRIQSHINAFKIDLHVLRTIINDYHTMLDNLIQNSINAIHMTDDIRHDHLKIDRILTS
ncbi:unnamed protein product, partial [Rotaria sp. Silwood2]